MGLSQSPIDVDYVGGFATGLSKQQQWQQLWHWWAFSSFWLFLSLTTFIIQFVWMIDRPHSSMHCQLKVLFLPTFCCSSECGDKIPPPSWLRSDGVVVGKVVGPYFMADQSLLLSENARRRMAVTEIFGFTKALQLLPFWSYFALRICFWLHLIHIAWWCILRPKAVFV